MKSSIYQKKKTSFFLLPSDQSSFVILLRIHPCKNDSYSESLVCCCGSRCSFDHVVGPWALFQSCPTAPSVAGSLENYDDLVTMFNLYMILVVVTMMMVCPCFFQSCPRALQAKFIIMTAKMVVMHDVISLVPQPTCSWTSRFMLG